MTNRVPRTDRRGVLRSAAVAALAVPLLGACDATDTAPARSTGVEPTASSSSGDQDLVDRIARQIAGTRAAAKTLVRAGGAQQSWAQGLVTLHTKHLRKLGAGSTRPTAVKAGTPKALVAAEGRLRDALVAASGQATSGALAQVLASMAAAVDQRVVSA